MKQLIVTLLFVISNAGHCFEIQRFAPPDTFWASGQTVTLSFVQPNAKGVVIFLPGGDGQFPIPSQTIEPRGFGIILKSLAESTGFSVVAVNSPYPLETAGSSYPSLRESSDHLDRIETVVKHFSKNNKVWLMGHSNGTFSVVALMRRLQKQNESNLIAGMILSGSRDVSRFNADPVRPVLFIHHAKDGCVNTLYTDAHRNYMRARGLNSQRTEFVTVDSDVAVTGHPCRSGYHMMQGAYIETADAISSFIKDAK